MFGVLLVFTVVGSLLAHNYYYANEKEIHQYEPNHCDDKDNTECFPNNPFEKMNVSAIIKYYGYQCEEHEVTTDDGYILTVQRLTPKDETNVKNEVVYLQHGLFDSSFAWVANLPNESLSYLLSDEGYDVWLGNMRGNTYGKRHMNLSTDDPNFWQFSFDQMAKYDLVAIVDYVLKHTGHGHLNYVAHSQGTMIGFIEFGRNAFLASKIKTFHALAPIATIGHIEGGLKILAKRAPEVEWMYDVLGVNEFLPKSWVFEYLSDMVCAIFHLTKEICGNIIFTLLGFDDKRLNMDRLPVYMSHIPAGTSVKNIVHFLQMIKNGKFQMYDFGEENKKRYGQPDPPQYNTSLMRTPVSIFSGSNDWLANPYDINEILIPSLQNIIYRKNIEDYNHLDFIWGLDAHKLVYQDIIKLLGSR